MKTIKKVETDPQYTHSIYIILRDGYSNQNQKYGVYVGQTSKSPDERFIQHKFGIKSARGLQKYGIQLLRSLWLYGKVNHTKKLCYETKLHLTLKEVIPKVSGDLNYDELDNC